MQQQLQGQTPHAYDNVSPAQSPDGSQIAFLTNRTGRWEIWVMNADGADQHPLFSDAVNSQLQFTYNFVDERILIRVKIAQFSTTALHRICTIIGYNDCIANIFKQNTRRFSDE